MPDGLLYNLHVSQLNKNQGTIPARSIDPIIEAYKKDVDRTLIRENLRLTVDERFHQQITAVC